MTNKSSKLPVHLIYCVSSIRGHSGSPNCFVSETGRSVVAWLVFSDIGHYLVARRSKLGLTSRLCASMKGGYRSFVAAGVIYNPALTWSHVWWLIIFVVFKLCQPSTVQLCPLRLPSKTQTCAKTKERTHAGSPRVTLKYDNLNKSSFGTKCVCTFNLYNNYKQRPIYVSNSLIPSPYFPSFPHLSYHSSLS